MSTVLIAGCGGGGGISTPPTVTSAYPANHDAGVAVNSVITATFSTAMTPSTINAATFTVLNGTTPVAGTVSFASGTATFQPAVPLAANTVFTATMTTGVDDVFGNALASNDVWVFKTGASSAKYALTVNTVNGSATPAPNQPTYSPGTVVTLTTTPVTDYHFTGWSGDLSGSANPEQITMTADKTVTANFAINTYTLTVTAAHGSVTQSLSQPTYNTGTVVTLTPVPAAGYHFTGWSGDLTGAANPASVTMTGNMTVTANFSNTYTLTIEYITGGFFPTLTPYGGTVTKSPNQTSYIAGMVVTLTEVPSPGWYFSFSGSLFTTNTLQITMTSDLTVYVWFQQIVYSLTVNAIHGSVTKSPNAFGYPALTVITLTAVPAMGYTFTGWSGDLSGATNPVQISLTANKNITANFAP